MSTHLLKPNRGCFSCLGGLLGACVVFLIGLYGLFLFNNRPPHLTIPTPVPPADNAYDHFVAAATLIRAIPHKAPASMIDPPKTREATLAATAACTKDAEPGLEMIRAAFSKPCMVPPQRTNSQFERVIRDQAAFRETARTISGVSTYYTLAGRYRDAADVSLDGAEMATKLTTGAPLTSGFTANAIEAICLTGFEQQLPRLSRDDLAHVEARLDRILRQRAEWSALVLEDGRCTVAMLLEAFLDPDRQGLRELVQSADTLTSLDPNKHRGLRDKVKFAFADKGKMLRGLLQYHGALSDEARRPFHGPSTVPIPDNPLVDMAIPLGNARWGWERNKAILRLLQIQGGLFSCKTDRGRFPDQLADLAPTYLKAIPSDPFGGTAAAPFHYRLTSNPPGFLLYSVGPDMTDDRGMPGRFPGDKPGTDIVAGKLWRKKTDY